MFSTITTYFIEATSNTLSNNDFTTIKSSLIFALTILGAAIVAFIIFNYNKRPRTKVSKSSFFNRNKTNEKDNNLGIEEVINYFPLPTALCSTEGMVLFTNTIFGEIFGSVPQNLKDLLIFNILPAHISTQMNLKDVKKGKVDSLFFSPNTNERYYVRWEKSNSELYPENSFWIFLENETEVRSEQTPIQNQEDLLQNIIDVYKSAIFIEDFNSMLLAANKKACELIDIKAPQLKSEIITNHSLSEFRTKFLAEKPLQGSIPANFKAIYYSHNGKAIPSEIHINEIVYFDRPAICYVIDDISDKVELNKEIENYKLKADESDRLKSSFLANLSHEVRTPLNTILGFAELLAEPDLNKTEKDEYLFLVRDSGKSLINQINNMIDFSKIEAGLISLKIDLYNIETLFHHLHEYASEEFFNRDDIKLYFDLPEEISENNIVTDRYRLKQILKIFLSNALQHSKKGAVEVGAYLRAPQLYEFYVRDTGIGIPEHKHLQIFENFRQVDDDNVRNYSGMGLGLSIAARLIQFLGGHQWVVSTPGKGSDFRCVIPDSLHKVDSPRLQVSTGPSTLIKKVMVISPNVTIYSNLCNNSKPINYQVFWAQNAQEMKAMLLSNKIRITLIDIDEITFWQEIVNSIKEIDKEVPIIGISNTVDAKRKERLITMGLNNVLKTAINIPILINILERTESPELNLLTSIFNKN